MQGYWPASICFVRSSPLAPPGDVDQCRHPVERRELLVVHCAWLDVSGPTHNHRGAIAAFPGLALLTIERRNSAIGEGSCLGAIVGGEDDNGVVELTHGFE